MGALCLSYQTDDVGIAKNCKVCNAAKDISLSDIYVERCIEGISNGLIKIANGYDRNDSCVINKQQTRSFIAKYVAMRVRLKSTHKTCICPQICYHWTNPNNFESIKSKDLKVPDGESVKHATDDGYYGKGIYTSSDPLFAQSYGVSSKVSKR